MTQREPSVRRPSAGRAFSALRKYGWDDRAFLLINMLILLVVFIVILYPLLFVIASSFSGGKILHGLSLIPDTPSLEGYVAVFENRNIWTGYLNAIIYTVAGTAIAMVNTVLCAYPLSRMDFKAGRAVMKLCVFTMYFSGGLIPTYLWIRSLGMVNTMWAILLPASLNVYNMIVMNTYFRTQIPGELRDSAQVDGCGEWRYLIQIVLPLSGAVLGVVALYYAVARWNGYFDSMVYLRDRDKMPLQNILREILIVNATNVTSDPEAESVAQQRAELLKYSSIVVATIPMMVIYPFIQKSFVKGVMIGSVKG